MRSALSRLWPWSGYAGRRRDAAAVLQMVASSYRDTQPSGSATALFQLAANGLAAGGPVVAAGSSSWAWLVPGSRSAEFQVVVTMSGGDTFSSGAGAGTHSLDETLEWRVTRSSTGSKAATATFSIEAIANPGVSLASAAITLTATIDAGAGGGGGPEPWPDNPFGGGENVN